MKKFPAKIFDQNFLAALSSAAGAVGPFPALICTNILDLNIVNKINRL